MEEIVEEVFPDFKKLTYIFNIDFSIRPHFNAPCWNDRPM
jgi:hypothetical protein